MPTKAVEIIPTRTRLRHFLSQIAHKIAVQTTFMFQRVTASPKRVKSSQLKEHFFPRKPSISTLKIVMVGRLLYNFPFGAKQPLVVVVVVGMSTMSVKFFFQN